MSADDWHAVSGRAGRHVEPDPEIEREIDGIDAGIIDGTTSLRSVATELVGHRRTAAALRAELKTAKAYNDFFARGPAARLRIAMRDAATALESTARVLRREDGE